jgi:hypothetical protein
LINGDNTFAESLSMVSHFYIVQNPRGTFLLRDKPNFLNCFGKNACQKTLIDIGEQITIVLFVHLQSTQNVTLHFSEENVLHCWLMCFEIDIFENLYLL